MDTVLILHHRCDLDGRASGAIALRKCPDAEVIGIDYGDNFPWNKVTPGRRVLTLDFSLQPFEDMLKLQSLCDLTWIDHHASAIEERDRSGVEFRGVQNTQAAACELTWKYLFPDEPVPRAVHLLSLYDQWRQDEDADVLPFQYGMRTARYLPQSPDWEWLFRSDPVDIQAMCLTGEPILQYQRLQDEEAAKDLCFETEMDGLKLLAVNHGGKGSTFFDSLWNPDKYDAMCSFGWKNGTWSIRLYTTHEDVDVGAICKAHGGGGHQSAAGFSTDTLPFPLR